MSFVAEENNAGVIDFVADITSMCGLGPGGIAAHPHACSYVRCCSHQFIFPQDIVSGHSSTLRVQLQSPPMT